MKWGQVERRMAKPKSKSKPKTKPQLLHLVFGGELKNTGDIEFKDLSRLDIVGMYPNFAQAKAAWALMVWANGWVASTTAATRCRRRPPWTMPRCAISWPIFTACSKPKKNRSRMTRIKSLSANGLSA